MHAVFGEETLDSVINFYYDYFHSNELSNWNMFTMVS